MSENLDNAEVREVAIQEEERIALLSGDLGGAAPVGAIPTINIQGDYDCSQMNREESQPTQLGHSNTATDAIRGDQQLSADPDRSRIEEATEPQHVAAETERGEEARQEGQAGRAGREDGQEDGEEKPEVAPLYRFTVSSPPPPPAGTHPPTNGVVSSKHADRVAADRVAEEEEEEEEEDGDEDYLRDSVCGVGPFRPAWLQRLASTKTYVLVYGLIGMCQFGLGSYYIATITTTEKRFKIPSWTSGLIASGWDVGAFSCSLMISYLGSQSHKTRWVSAGTILVGISCYIRLIPHFLYGPGLDALELTEEYGATANHTNNEGVLGPPLCGMSTDEEDCSEGAHTGTIAAAISFFSQVLLGVGTSMYYTLGIAYLDDNARKNKTPLLLAVWQCLRMLGPTVGFVFASYALQIYIDPHVHPTITVDDPRWMGAWWLGWAPFGTLSIALGAMMLMFPKVLPRAAHRAAEKAKTKPPAPKRQLTFKDFLVTMRRLMRNPILVFNSFSSVCFMFGLIGYWNFMPKYMETQFRQSAATASLISGSVGLVFSALGMIVSGAVITKFKPRARVVAGWNVMVELLDVAARIGYAFIGCPATDLYGSMGPNDNWNLTAACNSGCECGPAVKYSPICSYDKLTTFYSACHAGCTSQATINGSKIFDDCLCVGEASDMRYATDGACPVDCATNFIIFLIIECLVRFFSSTGRAGNTIIQFRCVDPQDKSVSIGFTEALLCALAFIPGPIVYGMILDYSCLVWGETCGQKGNCWLYDGQSLRYQLNLTAAAFLFAGTMLDIGVWYKVKGLEIYDDKESKENGLADEGIDRPML